MMVLGLVVYPNIVVPFPLDDIGTFVQNLMTINVGHKSRSTCGLWIQTTLLLYTDAMAILLAVLATGREYDTFRLSRIFDLKIQNS
jgi:hypothetical protein